MKGRVRTARAAPVSPATARGRSACPRDHRRRATCPRRQGRQPAPATSCRRPACRRSCSPSCHRQRVRSSAIPGSPARSATHQSDRPAPKPNPLASQHERARSRPATGASAHGLPLSWAVIGRSVPSRALSRSVGMIETAGDRAPVTSTMSYDRSPSRSAMARKNASSGAEWRPNQTTSRSSVVVTRFQKVSKSSSNSGTS